MHLLPLRIRLQTVWRIKASAFLLNTGPISKNVQSSFSRPLDPKRSENRVQVEESLVCPLRESVISKGYSRRRPRCVIAVASATRLPLHAAVRGGGVGAESCGCQEPPLSSGVW